MERSTEDGNLNGEIPTGITQRTKDRAHVTVDNPAPRTELPRVLTRYDVAALMINRMVGVGIFTNPSLVLWFCGSQWLALGMWFIGGLFSCLWLVLTRSPPPLEESHPTGGRSHLLIDARASFSIYVEYGNAWPFNGGELLYVNSPTFYSRWRGDSPYVRTYVCIYLLTPSLERSIEYLDAFHGCNTCLGWRTRCTS